MGRGSSSIKASGHQLLFGPNARAGTRSVRLPAGERALQTAIAAFESTGGVVRRDGEYRYWERDGVLDRDDGPAIERASGGEEWYRQGQLHRQDGPAVITQAKQEWWINGEKHREVEPAVEWTNGNREWYLNGAHHRADGPALMFSPGSKVRVAKLWAWRGERFGRQSEWQAAIAADPNTTI